MKGRMGEDWDCSALAGWGGWLKQRWYLHPSTPLHPGCADTQPLISALTSLSHFLSCPSEDKHNFIFPSYDVLLNVSCATGDAERSFAFQLISKTQPVFCFSLTSVFSSFSSSVRGLLPPGSGGVGTGGPHRVQGNRGSQSAVIHRRLHHPGHGRHAVPPGLPGLLRSHPRKQVSAPLCELADNFETCFCYWSCLCASVLIIPSVGFLGLSCLKQKV